MLEFDFVHLDEVQDEEDCLYEEDYVALQSQMAKIMSSSGKIELLKQVRECISINRCFQLFLDDDDDDDDDIGYDDYDYDYDDYDYDYDDDDDEQTVIRPINLHHM